MHNSESVQENESLKFIWDFEIHTGPLILARRSELVTIGIKKKEKKKNLPYSGLCRPRIPRGENEKKKRSEMRDTYVDLVRELKKLWNMKVTMILIVVGVLGQSPKDCKRNWKTWK